MLNQKKIETDINLKKTKKIIPDEKIESLPTKKIKPKIKPKPSTPSEDKITDLMIKPKPKPEPKFSIASMLKDLRNEASSQHRKKLPEKEEKEKNVEKISDQKAEINNDNLTLSISEIDLLRQQLSSCWIAPAGAVIEKGMIVKISAKINKSRRVHNNSVRILDTNISKTNPFYGPITESAMRTLLNPECIPLKLPKDKYTLWKSLTITFDYSIMKGY